MKMNLRLIILCAPVMFVTPICAQTHLICTDRATQFTSTVSIYKEGRRLVYQEISVVMKDGTQDQFGGTAKIIETPSQYRIKYENSKKNFSFNTMIDRITGEYIKFVKSDDGLSENMTKADCVIAKPRM